VTANKEGAMVRQSDAGRRIPLSRDRVLRAAVTLADNAGIESLNMRRLAQELGVVPMALYKHVANKDQLLDGMVDVIVSEISPPVSGGDWKSAVRQRILSARAALLRHAWASRVIESRAAPTPVMLAYLDSVIGLFRTGGFSVDLTHHVMHALGSRMWGFTQELFNDSAPSVDPEAEALMLREMAMNRSSVPAVTTSSSSSSPSTSSWTGSTGSSSKDGHPPALRPRPDPATVRPVRAAAATRLDRTALARRRHWTHQPSSCKRCSGASILDVRPGAGRWLQKAVVSAASRSALAWSLRKRSVFNAITAWRDPSGLVREKL
jgi:AcrR family transcriptional regulator